jgi:hypothetical protein
MRGIQWHASWVSTLLPVETVTYATPLKDRGRRFSIAADDDYEESFTQPSLDHSAAGSVDDTISEKSLDTRLAEI